MNPPRCVACRQAGLRIILPLGVATLTASMWWAFAQPAPALLAQASFPAARFSTMEAKDAGGLLRDWDTSR